MGRLQWETHLERLVAIFALQSTDPVLRVPVRVHDKRNRDQRCVCRTQCGAGKETHILQVTEPVLAQNMHRKDLSAGAVSVVLTFS